MIDDLLEFYIDKRKRRSINESTEIILDAGIESLSHLSAFNKVLNN